MSSILIRIGAMLDSSVDRSFRQAEQRAGQAATKSREVLSKAGKAQASDEQRSAAQRVAADARANAARAASAQRLNAMVARMDAATAASAERAAKRRSAADMRAFDDRLRAGKRARDAEERDILKVAATAERAEKRRATAAARENAAQRTAFGRELGHRTVSNLGQAARFGMGIAGSLARGAGVDLDLGASVGRNVELEKQAIDLSNSGYNPNAEVGDAARTRVDSGDIQKAVKEAADANAFSRTETMGGLQAFVGKTGDLKTGMAVMKDLGALSRATGSDLGDMVDAAGDVSSALGNMKGEEKVKRIGQVMKSIAGQGKLGAVEIKDLASQMAKVAVGATAFEGKAEDNIALMGAFAQMARQKGGATTANIAASSVSGMVNTFRTPARMAAFKNEGIDVVNKETGLLRNPEEILKAALAKTGGDPERMKKMFANTSGARAVEGSAETFRRARAATKAAGGSDEAATAAGLKAVTEELDKFKKVAMGEGEIRESLNKALASQSAKAQQFNNRMDDVTAKLQSQMAPALEKAGPGLIKFAEAMAGTVAWMANNPWKAVFAVAGAGIAKAIVETVVSQTIANGIKSGLGGGGGAAGGPAVPGGPGGSKLAKAAGSAFMIAAAAVTIEQAGELIIDKVSKDASDRENAKIADSNKAFNTEIALQRKLSGRGTKETDEEISKRAQELKGRIREGEAAKEAGVGGVFDTIGAFVAGEGKQLDSQVSNVENLDAMRAELARLQAAMETNKSAVDASAAKIVAAINASNKGGAPGVDPDGRDPKPGTRS